MKNLINYTDFMNENNSFTNIPTVITDYIDNFVKTNPEKATEIAMKYKGLDFKEIIEILKKENNEVVL